MEMDNSNKPLIVVVDDNPSNIQVIGAVLEEHDYEPAVFTDGLRALNFIEKEGANIDLILLDVMMPTINGIDLCKKIKATDKTNGLPVMFLTGKTSTTDIVQGFMAGAIDYVTKPFNMVELLSRVKTQVSLRHIQRQLEEKNHMLEAEIAIRKEVEKRLERLATIDTLTDISNRRFFIERAQKVVDKAIMQGEQSSILIIDVDFFKRINDNYGHHIGDTVLTQLGQLFKSICTEQELHGRIGGEEFAILLVGKGIKAAESFAERFRANVESTEADTEFGKLSITVSIGVAQVKGIGDSFDGLMKRADVALYKAKKEGRNRVAVTD